MRKQKPAAFVKKSLKIKILMTGNILQSQRSSHYTGECKGAAHSIYNLRYTISNKIIVIFHNGSNYDYQFIIKELGKEFKRDFSCLGENTEKYKKNSVVIKKTSCKNW